MYLFLTAYLLLAIPSAAAVLRQKQTPVVAIAWLLAIVLLPIGGSLFYLLAGYRKPVRDVPPTDSRPAAGIERMLWYGCSTRVRYRNRVEQLHDGGEAFAALISALQGARRYIHLSYYIFADDRIGHAIADILVRKARAGVEVRLLYDAIGSWKLSERFVRRLRGAGIEVRAYAPLRFPWFSPRANRRNHSGSITATTARSSSSTAARDSWAASTSPNATSTATRWDAGATNTCASRAKPSTTCNGSSRPTGRWKAANRCRRDFTRPRRRTICPAPRSKSHGRAKTVRARR